MMKFWQTIDVYLIISASLAIILFFSSFAISGKITKYTVRVNKQKINTQRPQILESLSLGFCTILIIISAIIIQITTTNKLRKQIREKPITWSQFLLGVTILLNFAVILHII